MGVIADGLVAYARPLIDQTDGSIEQMNKAFAMATLCYNLALAPEDGRAKSIKELQQKFAMNDEELEDFRQSIVVPMIRRHEEMFPIMHQRVSRDASKSVRLPHVPERPVLTAKERKLIEPYSPCPCNSGKKFRFCCGQPR